MLSSGSLFSNSVTRQFKMTTRIAYRQPNIVADFTSLIESTGIPNFAYYKVHAPCEIADERRGATPNSCSWTVRQVMKRMPASSDGFVIVPDWNKYYKSINMEFPKPAPTIAALICRATRVDDPLASEAELLKLLTKEWNRPQQLTLRLVESCLQQAGSNASAALIGSADDLIDLIDEGMDAIRTAEISQDDRARQMLRVPITRILSSDEEGIREICYHTMEKDSDDEKEHENNKGGDEEYPKMCHHFKTFLEKKSQWSAKVVTMCRDKSIEMEDLFLLVCAQKNAEGTGFDIPGGARKLGETTMNSLNRKLKEESGLTLNLGQRSNPSDTVKHSTVARIQLEDTFDCHVIHLFR